MSLAETFLANALAQPPAASLLGFTFWLLLTSSTRHPLLTLRAARSRVVILLFEGEDGETVKYHVENVSDLFNKNTRITITGSAGSGKSTLVKYLYVSAVEQRFKIPIRIELRYLNNVDFDLLEFIKQKIFKVNRLADSENIINRLLDSGKFLFFLDGFDEVLPSKMQGLLKDIDDLTRIHFKNLYLITSRNYLAVEELPLFENCQIAELEEYEILGFVEKQLETTDNEVSEKIVSVIKNSNSNSFGEFLRNPLLLTMFILTFRINAEIPTKKSLFYAKVFDALAYEHDSFSKLNYKRTRVCELGVDEIDDVLQIFSFLTYFNGNFDFLKTEIFEYFEIINEETDFKFVNSDLLNDLLVNICIFVKDGDRFAFAHRSLQEYFVSKYIKNSNMESKIAIYELINERLEMDYYVPISDRKK
jgi:predicted NACHT family NTPase